MWKFSKYIFTDADQTVTGNDIYNTSSSTFDGSFLKMYADPETYIESPGSTITKAYVERHENTGCLTGAVYALSVTGVADTSQCPSVSSFGKINSDEIYLFCEKKTFNNGSGSETIENVKFTDGIPL